MSARFGAVLLSSVLFGSAAVAAPPPETLISFDSADCFNVDFSQYPLVTFHGPEIVDLHPVGPTELDWYITVLATETGFELVEGAFAFHIEKELLSGEYIAFTLDQASGEYVLDWKFTGGTGSLQNVTGSGRTYGVADLATYCAQYTFRGTLFDFPY